MRESLAARREAELTKVQIPRERYIEAQKFLRQLKRFRKRLTRQQISTLRGQALAGDITGAEKGLGKMIMGRYEHE